MEHKVIIEDLYDQEFEPVLTVNERESCYSEKYELSNIAAQTIRLAGNLRTEK